MGELEDPASASSCLQDRAAGLRRLEAEELEELRAMDAQASIRVLEELLNAGFAMIDEMIDAERQTGGDFETLARYLLEDDGR